MLIEFAQSLSVSSKSIKVISGCICAIIVLWKVLMQTFLVYLRCSSGGLTCLLLYMGMLRFNLNMLECVCVRVKDSVCFSRSPEWHPWTRKVKRWSEPTNSWPHLLAPLLLHSLPHLIFAKRSFQKQRTGRMEERMWGMEVCTSFLLL